MIKNLLECDLLMVTRTDRLARSIVRMFRIVSQIIDAADNFRDLAQPLADTSISSGRKYLAVFASETQKRNESCIATINQLMDLIAISARERLLGLSEINTAVNEMDQVTQQNAAMVEETNAAGATRVSEATGLKDLVGHFQFGSRRYGP